MNYDISDVSTYILQEAKADKGGDDKSDESHNDRSGEKQKNNTM